MNSTLISDVLVLKLNKHVDKRGYILEIFDGEKFAEKAGVSFNVASSHETYNNYMALRGLHYQVHAPQSRLVRVSVGEIYDVAVDLRVASPTFGKWRGEILSAKSHNAMLIPKGFAHGYVTLSDHSIVSVYADAPWVEQDQRCIRWNDASLGVDWPLFADYPVIIDPLVSDKDMSGLNFGEAEYYY